MMILDFIFQDWDANKFNTKGRYVALLFRTYQLISRRKVYRYLFFIYIILYKLLVEYLLNIEISPLSTIGMGFKIYHGQGLVINSETIIGNNCIIRHQCTIGNKISSTGKSSKSPMIGDNVEIGCGSIIIGDICIGNNVTIGAGSLIVKDVGDGLVVGGVPARPLT